MTKSIHYSQHALFEMQRRQVRQADVDAAIRNPGQVVASTKGGKSISP
jgi:hypothetical protein